MLAAGVTAPDIDLDDLSGCSWSLAEALKRGPVLLAFFKISCPTCQLTFPFLQRLADGAGKDAPQLVAVSQDDAAGMAQFQQRFNLSMRTVIDKPRTYPASNAYGVSHVPSLFLVERDGRISLAVEGFSKAHLEKLGERFDAAPFHADDRVPVLQPG